MSRGKLLRAKPAPQAKLKSIFDLKDGDSSQDTWRVPDTGYTVTLSSLWNVTRPVVHANGHVDEVITDMVYEQFVGKPLGAATMHAIGQTLVELWSRQAS